MQIKHFLLIAVASLFAMGCSKADDGGNGGTPPPPEETELAGDASFLFIGNSCTNGYRDPILRYNNGEVTDIYGTTLSGIPGIFKRLAKDGGYPDIEVSIMSVNGRSLTEHYRDHQAKMKKKWDVVVVQDLLHRTLPDDKGGALEAMRTAVGNIKQCVKSQNDEVRVVLYETFAGPRDVPGMAPTLRGVQDIVKAGSKSIVQSFGLYGWAPVGEAFLETISEGAAWDHVTTPMPAGQVDIYYTDNYHPSKYGSYLAACVFYAYLLGKDPRALPTSNGSAAADLGVAASAAAALHKAAYNAVANNK